MSRKLFLAISSLALGMSAALSCGAAYALTPLTSAEIREIVRRVQFVPKGQPARDAILSEIMRPEDALHTMRSSRVGLRFNDGSWARVGEMAVFRFVPGTRNFRLTNGTVLLLIKPGQGRTTIDTPNASAGVRGSALFVRYDEQTETTVVGALTNNPAGPMEIVDNTTGRKLPLEAGQMAIVDPLGIRLFNFDMHRFYETSDIVRGLDLQRREAQPSPEPGIAAVQAETAQALQQQKPLAGPVIENPRMVQLSPAPETPPTQNSGSNQPAQNSTPTKTVENQPSNGAASNGNTAPPSGNAAQTGSKTPDSGTTPANSGNGGQGSPAGGQTTGSSPSGNQNTTGNQNPNTTGNSQNSAKEPIEQTPTRGASKSPDTSGSTGTSTPPNTSTGTTTPSNSTSGSTSTPNSSNSNSGSNPSGSTPASNNSANPPAGSVSSPAPNTNSTTNTPTNPTSTPPANNSTPPANNSTPPAGNSTPPAGNSTSPTSNPAPASTPSSQSPSPAPTSAPPTNSGQPASSDPPRQPVETTPTRGASQEQPTPIETRSTSPTGSSQPATSPAQPPAQSPAPSPTTPTENSAQPVVQPVISSPAPSVQSSPSPAPVQSPVQPLQLPTPAPTPTAPAAPVQPAPVQPTPTPTQNSVPAPTTQNSTPASEPGQNSAPPSNPPAAK